MDKIYGFLSNEELNKWEKLPVVVNILTSKEFGSWLLRRDENRDKQNNSRPKGEITDEDIRDAIKQGYKDGYAMARAKFERPKGDIEFAKWVADQIFFKEVKDDLFVELACRKLEKLGLVEKTESEWILRGGGENE